MAETQDDTDKARKERSPSFPFISLKKAVERTAEMAAAHKRSHARLVTVGETWGYGPKSSGLLQTVAALKAYGLIDDIGTGGDRKIQVSDLGWRILHDTREGVKEQAIREAALKPRLIAEYAAQWVPDRPSLTHCLSELHLDRGFTADAAKLFVRVFDETVSFANLSESDTLSPSSQGAEIHVPTIETKAQVHPPTVQAGRPIAPPVGEPFRVSFTGSGIEVTARLTDPASADDLIRSIEALKLLLRPVSDFKKPENE